jgi:hypothetical protein
MSITFFWAITSLCIGFIFLFVILVGVYAFAKGEKILGCIILLSAVLVTCVASTLISLLAFDLTSAM